MAARFFEKKGLSAKGLLHIVRNIFDKIIIKTTAIKDLTINLSDCLMSALAMFGLKFPSLLQFDQQKNEKKIKHNLKNLYGVNQAPSDTYMRECLDEVDPKEIRNAFKSIFTEIQRGKVLESYEFLDKHYLLLIDGTGTFSSEKVHCQNCCEKHHKDGKVTYHHQVLSGVIAHPEHREVFPLCPEPISKQDGNTKNDCERNASFRFLDDFRREHPHLKTIIVCDALSANGPFIQKLKELNLRYIIGVKPDGNKSLFEWIKGIELEKHEVIDEEGNIYQFQWVNKIPINDTFNEIEVNFLDCKIILKNGEKKHFSWITDIYITKNNVFLLARGGRAKWKIENETFNTLKNQGYHYEHNFGHGKKHLCHVFAFLMFLSFLIDQIQERCCGLFQAALKKKKTKISLWVNMKALFETYFIHSWEDLFNSITYGYKDCELMPNTC